MPTSFFSECMLRISFQFRLVTWYSVLNTHYHEPEIQIPSECIASRRTVWVTNGSLSYFPTLFPSPVQAAPSVFLSRLQAQVSKKQSCGRRQGNRKNLTMVHRGARRDTSGRVCRSGYWTSVHAQAAHDFPCGVVLAFILHPFDRVRRAFIGRGRCRRRASRFGVCVTRGSRKV